jgi:D-alanyl-D-alanine dipeptidase
MKRQVRWMKVGPSRGQARVAVVEPLAELAEIQVRDNNEPLVELHSYCRSISFQPPETLPPQFLARRTVAEMLNRARRQLPEGYRLLVISAWRSLEQQQEMCHHIYQQLRSEHPEWPENILRRETNSFVHPPDHQVPPGYCTGGAVDLTIIGRDGQLLDMTLREALSWQARKWDARAGIYQPQDGLLF